MATAKIKSLVSKKKRRFMEDGFDLDLSYITPKIIAMGFPSEALEGVYRNHMKDVTRFLDTRHAGHYKIYNLCSEREYDPRKFKGAVARYPFDDHNAPPFELFRPFCKDVDDFLKEDERNVAVVHCKAGKGRTGVMICAYLLHCKMWQETQDALDFYAEARTKNCKGVTIPSQVRYVKCYGRLIRENLEYRPTTLTIKAVRLVGIPAIKDGTCTPQVTVRRVVWNGVKNYLATPGPAAGQQVVFKSGLFEGISRDQREALLELHNPPSVFGDIKIEVSHKAGMSKEKMFHVWFNTFFIEGSKFVAHKPEVDKAHKDKKHKVFPADFRVEILFDGAAPKQGTAKWGRGADAAEDLQRKFGSRSGDGRERDESPARGAKSPARPPPPGSPSRSGTVNDLGDDSDDDDDIDSDENATQLRPALASPASITKSPKAVRFVDDSASQPDATTAPDGKGTESNQPTQPRQDKATTSAARVLSFAHEPEANEANASNGSATEKVGNGTGDAQRAASAIRDAVATTGNDPPVDGDRVLSLVSPEAASLVSEATNGTGTSTAAAAALQPTVGATTPAKTTSASVQRSESTTSDILDLPTVEQEARRFVHTASASSLSDIVWSDSDLTTDDEDDEEWDNLPITDV